MIAIAKWLLERVNRHLPELATGFALIVVIALIEVRRQPIRLSYSYPRAHSYHAEFPRTLTDSSGNRLTIPSRPRRIVSQTLGSDELLVGMCAEEQLIAVSSLAADPVYSNVVAQVRDRKLPSVKGVERIVELRPDLVFFASYSPAEQVELLRAAGIPVFRISNFDTFDGIFTNIRAVGYSVGDDACAAALVAQMQEQLNGMRRAVSSRPDSPRLMEYGTAGYTAGANTLIDEMIRLVGARNLSAEHRISGNLKISSEVVALWQPDFIVVGAPPGDKERVVRVLLSDPAIARSRAGRAHHIIVIDDRYLLSVSQYIIPAIRQLSEALQGSRTEVPS